uniref:UMP-CMP kinase n=1 Tax=Onchocerca volvulus TaxID=6282 RepID=A0A8R1TKQ4_ONCVO
MPSFDELRKVVFVLGPPGCGKGTQCMKLEKNLGIKHLSAGELLRAERKRESSQYGQIIESHIRNGTIVPVEITCKLLENAINDSPSAKAFLIDGFPRNQDNVDGWERMMLSKAKVLFVLYLHCPDDICVERCLSRNEGRSDDNEESLRKRIKTYHTQTIPIIEYYKTQNLVRQVSAMTSAEEVYKEVEKIFKDFGI